MTPSRVAARTAIANYLISVGAGTGGNGSVPHLNAVYQYPAKFTAEGEFFVGEDPGEQSGAMIFLYIEPQRSRRIELRGAPAGGKMVEYPFALDIIFRSTKQLSQDAGADNDTFLDALINAIEDSKTAGTDDGTVFSWGEGGLNGGDDLQLTCYYPRPLAAGAAATQINSRLSVMVLQQTT